MRQHIDRLDAGMPPANARRSETLVTATAAQRVIRADHRVELHRAITTRSGVPQRMLAHAPRNASSGCCGMSHVAAIAYVLPATGLIWPHVIGAQNHAIFFGYKCLFFRPH